MPGTPTGGTNGAVSITSSSTGSTVTVVYPADPSTTPPTPGHTDVFVSVPEWALRRFEHTMPPLRCDVTVDGSGAPVTVGSHA